MEKGIQENDEVIFVSGTGSVNIPFRQQPTAVKCSFVEQPSPNPGCGPINNDTCAAVIKNIGSQHRPRWIVAISWDIQSGGTRTLQFDISCYHHDDPSHGGLGSEHDKQD